MFFYVNTLYTPNTPLFIRSEKCIDLKHAAFDWKPTAVYLTPIHQQSSIVSVSHITPTPAKDQAGRAHSPQLQMVDLNEKSGGRMSRLDTTTYVGWRGEGYVVSVRSSLFALLLPYNPYTPPFRPIGLCLYHPGLSG